MLRLARSHRTDGNGGSSRSPNLERDFRLRKLISSPSIGKGVTFKEALALVGDGEVIASNLRLDEMLLDLGPRQQRRKYDIDLGWIFVEDHHELDDISLIWTGDVVAYGEPDKSLRESVDRRNTICYHDPETGDSYYFSVSRSLLDKYGDVRNFILTVEHPNYDLVEIYKGHYVFVLNGDVADLVEKFPTSSGTYAVSDHLLSSLPLELWNFRARTFDEALCKMGFSYRRLFRREGAYVGPIMRGFRTYPSHRNHAHISPLRPFLMDRIYLDGSRNKGAVLINLDS